jgi:hypothetical protein
MYRVLPAATGTPRGTTPGFLHDAMVKLPSEAMAKNVEDIQRRLLKKASPGFKSLGSIQ